MLGRNDVTVRAQPTMVLNITMIIIRHRSQKLELRLALLIRPLQPLKAAALNFSCTASPYPSRPRPNLSSPARLRTGAFIGTRGGKQPAWKPAMSGVFGTLRGNLQGVWEETNRFARSASVSSREEGRAEELRQLKVGDQLALLRRQASPYARRHNLERLGGVAIRPARLAMCALMSSQKPWKRSKGPTRPVAYMGLQRPLVTTTQRANSPQLQRPPQRIWGRSSSATVRRPPYSLLTHV